MTVTERRGRVHVVATPIGNLDDLSPRAVRVLAGEVSVIACEDTRHTARLCSRFHITTPRISLHAHNEARRVPRLLERLGRGESIAVVSDAGTPLISDPGARLVRAALDAGFEVLPVPGPSAVTAALVASGLASHAFAFFGFLPRRGRERRERLEQVAGFPGCVVLYEAPGRVNATLADLHAAAGPRRVAVCRELTKRHESVIRGRLGEVRLELEKGEVTLVVEGPDDDGETRAAQLDHEALDARIDDLLEAGHSARDAARQLAEETGLPRSAAYARVHARRR